MGSFIAAGRYFALIVFLAGGFCSAVFVRHVVAQSLDALKVEAGQGDAQAQYHLGVMLYDNARGALRDYPEAAKWFRQAAAQGHALAQYNLGVMYYRGEGTPRDYAEAAKWFRQAATKGYALAQYNLGVMYYRGEGALRDSAEAAKWFRQAATQGYALAQYYLGVMYYNGEGVPRDYVEAYMWFSLAAAQGDADARKNLDLTETLLTREQRAEAAEDGARVETAIRVPAALILQNAERF